MSSFFDNPSAGKFEPPPSSRPAEPSVRSTRRRTLGIASLALVAFRELLRFGHIDRSFPFIGALTPLAILIASFAVDRKRRKEADDDSPYSPPQNLTR